MRSLSTTREETKKAETYLSNLQKELSQNDIQVETRVIAGSPAAVIKETAEQENADLIAIASHGRGGLARVFYGSVAAAILNQVDRPLLLVRSRNIKE
jgi:nucleotide-binding universal stress UspA family protein